ncbi:MAG: hypothetical protein ACK514_02240 [Bacteroidota bacterium]|nr:hypothetical protein [Cytophagales bacterium]MCE2958822.1 hypothetical protein [Flammeovirgaceae bacterium]MCZ8069786.1 hypothetical protein [Cytophagales bacterium]
MKRRLTLFLLILFLLNVVGYYGVLLGLRVQTSERFRNSIDRESIGTELTFKIPLAIPYAVDANEYSPVEGEFEYQGEVYQLVKQKHLHDTLYIVCVKDRESKKINQALADYVKSFTDKPVSQKQGTKTIQLVSKDFFSTSIELTGLNRGFAVDLVKHISQGDSYLSVTLNSPQQPPEFLS